MPDLLQRDAPIIVGAVGGSGTRVVAEILRGAGVFLGRDLNAALDNLTFTALFMRPRWWSRAIDESPHKRIRSGFRLFTESMFNQPPRSLGDVAFVAQAFLDPSGPRNPRWKRERLRALMSRGHEVPATKLVGWGWKEPIAHLFLTPLAAHYDGLKYIHVVRHGLDMAFSDNHNQAKRWGSYFGVPFSSSPEVEPRALLQYWAIVNSLARESCVSLGPERALIVRFEDLCASPQDEIGRILDFVDIEVDGRLLEKLVRIPRLPPSADRFRRHSLEIFRDEDLAVVSSFGFDFS